MGNKAAAIKMAIGNSAVSGLSPRSFALDVYKRWIDDEIDNHEAISILKNYHIQLENGSPSDGLATRNLLGITDGGRLKAAEVDLTTMRMAELFQERDDDKGPDIGNRESDGAGYGPEALAVLEGLDKRRR